MDIHHYLLGEAFKSAKPNARVEIDVRRVPMNLNAVDLAHLSDIPITIDPNALAESKNKKRLAKFADVIASIGRGYCERGYTGARQDDGEPRPHQRLNWGCRIATP